MIDANNKTTAYLYSPLGHITKVTDSLGNFSTTTYNKYGWVAAKSDLDLGQRDHGDRQDRIHGDRWERAPLKLELAVSYETAHSLGVETVDATELKTNLGGVLARAAVDKLAIRRHGRIVAYLVPAREVEAPQKMRAPRAPMPKSLSRSEEERLLELAASGDTRPSRWRRAGNPQLLAGVAALLGSLDLGNRERLLFLAEQLWPGMSTLEVANEWLRHSPVKADRFVPMLRARLAQQGKRP